MNETKEWPIDRFLQKVASATAKDDRGYLAELRSGLNESTQDQAWEHIIPYCSDFDANSNHRVVWCTIGGLAAILIPSGLVTNESWNNFGTTMRALAKGNGESDEAKALKSFEPKFRRALSCNNTTSLCEMVVGIGRTAARKDIPVNLRNLFWDLWSWDDYEKRDKTRLQWAKQFFHVSELHSDLKQEQEGENV